MVTVDIPWNVCPEEPWDLVLVSEGGKWYAQGPVGGKAKVEGPRVEDVVIELEVQGRSVLEAPGSGPTFLVKWVLRRYGGAWDPLPDKAWGRVATALGGIRIVPRREKTPLANGGGLG